MKYVIILAQDVSNIDFKLSPLKVDVASSRLTVKNTIDASLYITLLGGFVLLSVVLSTTSAASAGENDSVVALFDIDGVEDSVYVFLKFADEESPTRI